ncbi:YceI family protein [Kocuria palustris]|uniref:YceI family protein n=1 Tax=Kocuria palustris TaxID=71999 RepID=UPI0011A92E78|nr:YceI family protein [Kocuria palustris]
MSAQPQLAGTWTIDPAHSRIGFSSRHAMVTKVRGAFNDVEGTAVLDPEDMARSRVRVVLRVESVDTRNPQRDEHLRSADFFDAASHPTIEFASSAVDEIDENQFIVTGDLSIRGITRSISVPLEMTGMDADHLGLLRFGLEGSRRIDRKDWGVSWNTPLDSGGVLVSDKITLEFELSLVKDAEQPS